MPSIHTLIGERFEAVLQRMYPQLRYIGDERNLVPDFEHELFYAEAKVSYCQPDYASHLKEYQIVSFSKFERKKPVIYIVGFHDFERSNSRLAHLSSKGARRKLSKQMNILRFFLVDNKTITLFWNMRNYVCKRGHIQDCTLREGHLRQIITNKVIGANGSKYLARDYYGIPSKGYSFCLPEDVKNNGVGIGHILPSSLDKVIEFFYR